MSSSQTNGDAHHDAPQTSTSAVLKPSAPVPADAQIIHGIDFQDHRDAPITVEEMVEGMSTMGFQASAISEACRIVNSMISWRSPADSNSRSTIFLGYTSNLVSSGLREVIRYLVQNNHVAAIVTTAGGVEEDLIKCLGPTYMGDFAADGAMLRESGINRIGNLYVPNDNYCKFEDWVVPIFDKMLEEQESSRAKTFQRNSSLPQGSSDYEPPFVWTPSTMIARLGAELNDDRSILTWASRNDIPVFCPALTDGSLGDMLYFHSYKSSPRELTIDIRRDIRRINDLALKADYSGMIILGGGIVKHHIANANLMRNGADAAVYINTANEFDGSDAGARPDEAVSWGKIRSGAEGGRSVKVYAEATVVFPMIVAATFARVGKQREEHMATQKTETRTEQSDARLAILERPFAHPHDRAFPLATSRNCPNLGRPLSPTAHPHAWMPSLHAYTSSDELLKIYYLRWRQEWAQIKKNRYVALITRRLQAALAPNGLLGQLVRRIDASCSSTGFIGRNARRLQTALAGHEFMCVLIVSSVVALILVLSMLAHVSESYPSPRSLDTDISLLFENDLWGPGSQHQESALVLSKAQNHSEALRSCSSLGDRLFNITDRSLDFLKYLGHNVTKRKQRYWIAGQKGVYCNTVNYNGASRLVHCNEALPSLCSQSAPMSNAGWADLSPRWRVEVNTGNQTYQGYRDQRSFRFIGIRYALQPFRFTHSVEYDGPGVFEAIHPPPWCAQGRGRGEEDCLFLNIWTPHLPLDGYSSENLRPVMFFIHGGAFVVGSGSEPNFDGGNMASRGDVVVVTFNYRLGTLGFLALDDNATTGNWGLGDQVTALDWVRSHIRDFGGDPKRITIFGQSAGAASVRALLGAPQARGKYHAAIMQSGLGGLTWSRTYSHYLNVTEVMDVASQGILDRSWCNRGDMARKRRCLQNMKAKKIQNLRTEPARYLVIDHSYIDYHYLPLNESSRVNSVPLLMGTMADDSAMFIPPRETKNLTKGLLGYDYNATYLIKSHQFPLNKQRNKTDAVYDVVLRASMDSMFRCLGQATAATASNYSTFPSLWYYEFHRGYSRPPPREQCEPPSTKAHPDGDPTKNYLKCHSGDIIYVFGNMARSGWPIRDEYEIPFSQYILDMWTSFARHHDPNPNFNYLRARNYNDSLAWFDRTGTWPKVTGGSWEEGGWRLRELKVNSTTVGFKERNQCETLQLPIDFYEMGNQTVEEPPSTTPSETDAS